jgi:hypothetical protein
MEEQESSMFLRNIGNPEFTWTFKLIGRKTVVGRVMDFLWTEQGIPVTLAVQPTDGDLVEIPWGSIQTISRGKA